MLLLSYVIGLADKKANKNKIKTKQKALTIIPLYCLTIDHYHSPKKRKFSHYLVQTKFRTCMIFSSSAEHIKYILKNANRIKKNNSEHKRRNFEKWCNGKKVIQV